MYETIKLLVPDLNPQKILVDFEKANMNAALLALPEAEIKGCYYNLCHSLVRKIQSVGLKSEFECNMECKSY